MRSMSSRFLRPLSSLQAVARVADIGAHEASIPLLPHSATPVPPHSTSRLRLPIPTPSIQPTVELAYERYGPALRTTDAVRAIVIVPGLFSSAELWRTLSRSLAQTLQIPVYALSLRNHGSSPHVGQMSHSSMAADVLQFCKNHGLSRVSLLGHSLGAKVAMALALRPDLPPNLLDNIIIGDSAPVDRPLDADVSTFLDAMKEIEEKNLQTREEAIQILRKYTESKPEIKFILTNLHLRTPNNPADPAVPLRFRIPLDTIRRSVISLGYFPYKAVDARWPGQILFLKGSQSEFLNSHSISIAERLFPNMKLETLEGGHWLPFDNPKAFLASVNDFIANRKNATAN